QKINGAMKKYVIRQQAGSKKITTRIMLMAHSSISSPPCSISKEESLHVIIVITTFKLLFSWIDYLPLYNFLRNQQLILTQKKGVMSRLDRL
ncbi:hypothetical protein L9F63_018967, partial [Diploptera punctata]